MKLDIIFYKTFYNELENLNNEELINHYNNYGIKENRIYSINNFYEIFPFFSLENYILFNPDLSILKSEIEYLKHFYFYGRFENRKYHKNDFNLYFYKIFNKDLSFKNDKEYINHYIKSGINENRIKSKDDFDKLFPKYSNLEDINEMYKYYCRKNKIVNKKIDLIPNFDIQFYKFFNKDLIFTNDDDFINHYLDNGIKEKRLISKKDFYKLYPDFDIDIYSYYNKDIKYLDEMSLMYHFHIIGKNEKRDYKFINNLEFFNIELIKKFHKYPIGMDDKAIFKDYIKNKENYIGNLNDFYSKYPDFNISIYKIFFYSKSILEENIFKNILNELLDTINNKNKIDITKLTDYELIYYFYINDKKDIIYSLKSFYNKFSKFDYYKYRYIKNIKNIGEVETILNWYLNDFNYDFININVNENTIKYNYKNIIIYPYFEFSNMCGGIVVQYYLAQILDKIGIKVRIKLNNNYRQNDIYNNYFNDDFNIEESIIIYGETIEGNPLNATNTVRWILAELGIISNKNIYKTWGKNDLIYYFNSELKFFNKPDNINYIYKNLSLLYINPLFKNNNLEKMGFCHTYRKSKYHKNLILIHPQNSYEITRNHNQEDYNDIFNKYEFFISYDPLTFLNILAAICGCISIVYPIEGLNKKEWLKMTALADYVNDRKLDSLYGIAYGYNLKEILFAYNTLQYVKDQWEDINLYFKEKYIMPFIIDINNILNCKNTNENNFYI